MANIKPKEFMTIKQRAIMAILISCLGTSLCFSYGPSSINFYLGLLLIPLSMTFVIVR